MFQVQCMPVSYPDVLWFLSFKLEKLQKQNVDIQSALRKLERHHVDIQNRFDQQENRSSPASSSGHWAAHEVNREELASRLFDSLDTSRFGMISKDDLIPALEVYLLQQRALPVPCLVQGRVYAIVWRCE